MQTLNLNDFPQNKIAIIIGLDYVKNNDKMLQGCTNDTTLIIKLLIENYNYEPENIYLFTDYSYTSATKKNIIEKFNYIIKNKTNIDNIFLYFSGHGNSNCIFLENNEPLYDYEIKTNLLSKLAHNTRIVFILDCCKSGNFFRIGNWITNFNLYKLDLKLLLFSACKATEIATEIYNEEKGAYFGLFTYYLCKILNKHKNCSWSDLLILIKKYIKKNNDQEPEMKTINFNLDDDIIL